MSMAEMKKRAGKLLLLLLTTLVMLLGMQTASVWAEEADENVKLTFRSYYDTTDSRYAKLNVSVRPRKKVTLPAPPAEKGYVAVGWALKDHSKVAYKKTGEKFRVKRDTTLYAVYERDYKTVKFRDNSGKNSRAFKALTTKTWKSKLRLPEPPKKDGYRALGWTTTKKGETPLYKVGKKFKLKEKSIKLYAVYEEVPYYDVTFYRGNGSRTQAYKALAMRVPEGEKITLPEVPGRTGYVSIGWSNKKNPTNALKSQTYEVKKDMKFYAVEKKAVEVTFYSSDGSDELKTTFAAKGQGLRMPNMRNVKGSTFMGWSTRRNQQVEPMYAPGSVMTVKADEVSLYAVMYDHDKEQPEAVSRNVRSFTSQTRNKYKEIIFIGDSRTNRMAAAVNGLLEETDSRRVKYISEEGAGYKWLTNEGFDNLEAEVKNGGAGSSKLPTAVIVNVGVNDMANMAKFHTFLNGLADEFKEDNCDMYFMTLNPVNTVDMKNAGITKSDRTEENVLNFNGVMQNKLKGYEIIHTYNFLMRNGYVFDTGIGTDSGVGDGLHYSENTYRKIYNMCMQKLLEA